MRGKNILLRTGPQVPVGPRQQEEQPVRGLAGARAACFCRRGGCAGADPQSCRIPSPPPQRREHFQPVPSRTLCSVRLGFCWLAFASTLNEEQLVDMVIRGPRATVTSRHPGHQLIVCFFILKGVGGHPAGLPEGRVGGRARKMQTSCKGFPVASDRRNLYSNTRQERSYSVVCLDALLYPSKSLQF